MKFMIPGKPQPQERPFFHHRFMATDRPKSRAAKKLVAQYAQLAIQASKPAILGPQNESRVKVILAFFGASLNADLDNMYKLVTDALQGVLYNRDSQIDVAEIWRHPSAKGQERTEVEIVPI